MQASHFDELEFYAAIAGSGARALLIGRRALIALGIPVVTGDYDFWIHIDDIAKPAIPDLIATKRFGARTKDAEDIRLLERALAKREK